MTDERNAKPKKAAVEVYGFVGWVISFVVYGIDNQRIRVYLNYLYPLVAFCLWAFLPDSALDALGITYYPSKFVLNYLSALYNYSYFN